jgi:hypothetical protein
MRVKYNLDLRSLGDAGIAEKVILAEYEKATGIKPHQVKKNKVIQDVYQYKAPDFIKPITPQVKQLMQDMESLSYTMSDSGHPMVPALIKDRVVAIGDKSFKIGLGGLHSIDGKGMYEADNNHLIVDVDVTSFYPAIMRLTGLYPPQMSEEFCSIFNTLIDNRLTAKKAGNTSDANSLKIVINSTFGKTGDQYSALYAPNLTIAITLTGQLALLTLIELMEQAGLGVISANTDGVTVRIRKEDDDLLKQVCSDWEQSTGFNLERSDYKLFAQQNVNAYIAVTTDDKVKAKGALAVHSDLTHNPVGNIIQTAVIENLKSGISLEQTILGSVELTDFLFVKKSTGGATKDGQPIGSVIRSYYSTNTTTPMLKTNGNKVPDSEGAMPVQDLPGKFPKDIDFSKYINAAKEVLADITVPKRQGMNRSAAEFSAMGYSPAPIDHSGMTLYADDFNHSNELGTQTGERCGLINVNGIFYTHTESGWPRKLTATSKKLGFPVHFGGVVPIGKQTEINPLPYDLKIEIFNALTKTQKVKIEEVNLMNV